MARYTVRFAGRARQPVDRDVKGVNLVVERDGDYFQFGLAVVHGLALATEYGESRVAEPAFWSDVARASIPLVAGAVRRGDMPLATKTDAYEVQPQHVKHSGGVLEEGDVAGEFEV